MSNKEASARSKLETKLALLNGEAKHLKIFSCSLDSIAPIESRLMQQRSNQSASNPTKAIVGSQKTVAEVGEHLYEFLGMKKYFFCVCVWFWCDLV